MNDFQTGQVLTAKDLNELKKLADGQNMPTDGEFIKSNGVNMWKTMNATSPRIVTGKGFDLQVRFLPITEGEGEEQTIKIVGFWFVKIGSSTFVGNEQSNSNQLYAWDCCFDGGFPEYNNIDVARVMSLQISTSGTRKGVINFYPFYQYITDEKLYFNYEAYKSCADQTITGDGAGWYNTGVSIDFEDNDVANGGILYATLVGVGNTTQSAAAAQQELSQNTRKTVLMFSNSPINELKNINDSDGNPPYDVNGYAIQPLYILGNSTCIAYAFRRDYTDEETGETYSTFDIHYSGNYPCIEYRKSEAFNQLRTDIQIKKQSSSSSQSGSGSESGSGNDEEEEKLEFGHYINVPYVIYNGEKLPVYKDGEETPNEKLKLEDYDVWKNEITQPCYVGCFVKIDPFAEDEETGKKSPKAYIDVKIDEYHNPEGVINKDAKNVYYYSELWGKLELYKDDSESEKQYEYIPLSYSYVNVTNNGFVFNKRVIMTELFCEGIPVLNSQTPRHFDIKEGKVVNCIAQIGAEQEVTTGEYEIEDNTKDIWLHVTKSGSGAYDIQVDQEFRAETDNTWSILLWKYDTPYGETTKRYIDVRPGHISLGGGGTSDALPRHFDFKDNKVVNCKIYCGNKWVTCGDYSPSPTGGDIYLNIERTTSQGYVISVSQTPYQESDNRIAIKLWEYSDGKATLDVRPGIIPVFAL